MSETAQAKEKEPVIYDASEHNRFEFEARGNDGLKYDTAHVYGELTDERYLQWLKEFKIKHKNDEVSEEAREASARLWDDVIIAVENIDYPEGADWKSLINPREKVESLNKLLAVALGEDQEKSSGKRRLGDAEPQTIVITEAWFNGEISQQRHVVKTLSLEYQKKYSRIQAKRFKQEKIGGLRGKPKIEFIPQDEKIGELYDEIRLDVTGFANGTVPLRFKTFVVHHLFEETLDEKKSQT